jgi:hypothetical protein
MDHILQKFIGSQIICMMDGFIGYNHVLVKWEYRHKTVFTTPCSTFVYDKIPFMLMNVGATF